MSFARQPSQARRGRGGGKRGTGWGKGRHMTIGLVIDPPHDQQIFRQESSLRSKNFFLEAVTPKNDIFINFIYACLSPNLAGCQDYGAGGQEKKKKMKYEISGQERTWKHQETIEKFLNTESFSWGKVCLHSKSKGYIPAVKFFRFKIVTIQKNFKLFRIWKALKLWQSIIELILQNFLLSRIIPTHKEMCNCFFLPTFTAICITVANFKAISI